MFDWLSLMWCVWGFQSKIVNTSASYEQRRQEAEGEGYDDGEGDGLEELELQFHEIQWQPGMQCFAPWSKDGKLNGAVIKEVSQDRLTVTVAFEGYGLVEKCTTSRIKHPKQVSCLTKQVFSVPPFTIRKFYW